MSPEGLPDPTAPAVSDSKEALRTSFLINEGDNASGSTVSPSAGGGTVSSAGSGDTPSAGDSTVSAAGPAEGEKQQRLYWQAPRPYVVTSKQEATGPASVYYEPQADGDEAEHTHNIRCYKQSGKGVGRSRNAALSNAYADICLFGDEDIVYDEGYEEKVLRAFVKHPEASLITFNVRVDERRRTYWNEKPHRIRWYNYGRYPAYAIAVRRRDITKNNICYSKLFGGGARYSNGEDSLFLHDCLKAGLVLYAETAVLGEETYRESTWFKGYTDKFFYDRGVLYHFLYGKAAALFGLRFLLANRNEMLKDRTLPEAYALLRRGIGKGRQL